MAITITDSRTIIDAAESLTGWSNPNGASALTLYGVGQGDTTPEATEGNTHIGQPVSNETADIVHTITAIDYSNTLVYIWVLANGIMDTSANGGVAVVLADATPDRIGYHVAGSDSAAFRHANSRVNSQCLVVDTASLPATFTTLAGSEANLDLVNVTEIGVMYKTLVKSVGGVENCFTDIIRVGSGGITITDNDIGTVTFDDIAVEDADSSANKKYGIFRELGAGLYGCQGPLSFGGTGTETLTFADTDTTVIFEDRGLGTSRYSFTIQEGTGSTSFTLGTKVGTDSGSNGCTISIPTGVGGSWISSNANLSTLGLYGSTFTGFSGGITFSSDATNAPNHEIYACTFSGNGQIAIGLTDFKNCSISASTDANGSVLIDSTTNVSDIDFTSDGTGHGILIDTAGTYTFTNFTYTNFAATDGSTGNEVLYNNSGGAVTINVVGGDTPTVRNGAGASTTVNNNKNITITVIDGDGNPAPGALVAVYQNNAARTTIISPTTTNASGQVTGSAAEGTALIVRARQSANIATFDASLDVNSVTDVITTDANHHFQNGDAFTYDKDGNTGTTGLTDGTVYYAGNVTANTLQVYNTAANAITGGATGLQSLVGNIGSETHLLDPVRYISASATGTIGSVDFTAQISLVEDIIATG